MERPHERRRWSTNPGEASTHKSPFTGHTHRPCNPLGAIPPFPVESKCVHLARQPLIRTILWPTSVLAGKPTRAAVTVHESGRKRPPQQSFHRAQPPPLQSLRGQPSVPGGIKVRPPGTVYIPATTPDPSLRSRWNQTVSTWHTYRPCNPLGAIPPFPVESDCFHRAHRPLISYILWPTSVPGGKTNSGVTKCDQEWYPAESKRRWTQPPTAYLCSPSTNVL